MARKKPKSEKGKRRNLDFVSLALMEIILFPDVVVLLAAINDSTCRMKNKYLRPPHSVGSRTRIRGINFFSSVDLLVSNYWFYFDL